MKTQRHLPIDVTTGALGLNALAVAFPVTLLGCNDPFPPDTTDHSLEDCAASEEWVMDAGGAYTQTPELPMFKPLPHPTTECPFYRGGWQNFLRATQPTDAAGKPAVATNAYATIDDVFAPKVPHTGARSYLGDIKQAGLREILVDQNGNTLYYSIQVNPAFADFIHQNHLETSKAIQAYTGDATLKNLFFPAGVAEFKAAWQIVEGDRTAIDAQTADYVSMVTTVPTIHAVPDPKSGLQTIVENRDQPRSVTVRLLPVLLSLLLAACQNSLTAAVASIEQTIANPTPSVRLPNHRASRMPVSSPAASVSHSRVAISSPAAKEIPARRRNSLLT